MDPVALVVTALTAGAAAGVSGTATVAVGDAYAALKGLLKRRFSGHRPIVEALDGELVEPDERSLLVKDLTAAGGADPEVIGAAMRLLAVTDPAGAKAGKYSVDMREAKGVQVGDHNTQHNTFG